MLPRSAPSSVLILLLAFCWAAIEGGAWAGEAALVRPTLPKAQGERCVAEPAFMRRYHMTVLDHQRDGTVRQGLRPAQFSLKGCLACHAVKGSDGQPVSAENPRHFCRVCHDYAAVKLDCFECHASRPDAGTLSSADAGARALARYLDERGSQR